MKLVKFVPAIAATSLFLAACSTANTNSSEQAKKEGMMNENMKTHTSMMQSTEPNFEVVPYLCDVKGKKNTVVTATYAFLNGKVDTATVSVDNVVVGHEMKLDTTYQDGTKFVEGKKVWSLDYGFTEATATKTVPVMFSSDNKILAKNCRMAR